MDIDFSVNVPQALPTGAGDVVLYSTRDVARPLQPGEVNTRRISGWYQTDVASTLKFQVWTGSAWITYNGPAIAGDAFAANAFASFDIPRPSGDLQVVATLASPPTIWRVPKSVRLSVVASDLLRAQIVTRANGYFAETMDRKILTSTAAHNDGQIYLTSIGLLAGELVSGIDFFCGTGGSALTLAKMGLYDRFGTRLAVSTDQGAAWVLGTGTLLGVDMLVPYRITISDAYYGAWICKGGAVPQAMSATGSASSQIRAANCAPICASVLAQTDLPASIAFAVAPTTLLSRMMWLGFR